MAETDKHRREMAQTIEALILRYADRKENVYVSGNNFVYWEEGNPRARVSPDCYVVFGVPMRLRDSYMAWREGGHLPAVVFEFTSRKTRREDVQLKRPLYETTLRVPEYFQFDPTGDYLRPRLQGLRRDESGIYQPIPLVSDRLHSEQLGLDLLVEGDTLRLYDPVQDRLLPTLSESEAQRAQAETQRAQAETQRAQAEAQRAQAQMRADSAEAENARLRAELEALRGDSRLD